jgi:hypothetical protein
MEREFICEEPREAEWEQPQGFWPVFLKAFSVAFTVMAGIGLAVMVIILFRPPAKEIHTVKTIVKESQPNSTALC